MKKLFYYFLTHPVTTAMLFFSIVVMGIGSLLNLPVELQPQTEMRKLSVSAYWYGTAPETIEAQVTSVIEAELASIRGLKNIISDTREGSCNISFDVQETADIQFIRIEVNEKLASIKKSLPYGVIPVIQEYVPQQFESLGGFLTYEVSANLTANEIRRYLEQYVEYPLKAVDGVSDVSISGGNKREIRVLIDHNKAKNLDVTNGEINNAIQHAQRQTNAGVIKKDNNQVIAFAVNRLTDPMQIAGQVVKQTGSGAVVKIGDIARIEDGYAEPISFFRINGNDAVTIVLDREPGTNILNVANDVKKKVEELSKKFPAGFSLNLKMDKSEEMVKSLEDLYSSAGYSLIIILLVLFIIFRNFRYPVIIFSSILFSIAFSFIFFNIFGLGLNTLTISSFVLGLGFMVDNSIVVVDYVDNNYKGNGNKYLAATLKNIFFPVFASTLTTISVFIPVMYFTGELKIYFQQFSLGVVFTLIASIAVSFTIVPMLQQKYGRKIILEKERKPGVLFKIYKWAVSFFARRRKTAILIIVLMIGLPVWKIPARLEYEDVPEFIADAYNEIFDSDFYQGEMKKYVNYALGGTLNLFLNHVNRGEFYNYGSGGNETVIYIGLSMPTGNKIERMNELVKNFEKEILLYKGQFKEVVSHCDESTGRIQISFTPAQAETSFPYQIFQYIGAYGSRHGGLGVYVSGTNMGQPFSNGGFGGGSTTSSTVRVQGFNFKRVKEIAEEFKAIISRNNRVDKVDIENSGGSRFFYGGPEMQEVKGYIKRDMLARHNISVAELFQEILRNTSGNLSGSRLQLNNEEVYLNVKTENFTNISLEELQDRVLKQGSESVKIKDLMDFEEAKAMSSIYREDQQYTRIINLEIKGPPQLCQNIIEDAALKTNVPEGYKLVYKYDWYFPPSEEEDIAMVLLFAVLLIFMIISGLFESFSKPLLILFAIPFAIMGTVFLFFMGEYSIDRGAYAGMLLLIGLSVNNSIILVHHIAGHWYSGTLDDLIRLSYSRFRSIFTTTLTTIAGLFPMMVVEQQSFWKSLSLSVAGGILISALIVLFLLPAIYYWFRGKKGLVKVNPEIEKEIPAHPFNTAPDIS